MQSSEDEVGDEGILPASEGIMGHARTKNAKNETVIGLPITWRFSAALQQTDKRINRTAH